MSSTPDPLDPSFQIALPAFEGPLDLLLHLIKTHELEILDLPIAFVTERYLSYITVMEKLDLDIASEYLVMAATLAHIKSKMLLPHDPKDQEDEAEVEELDPRAELIRRLLEYQKYKLAAEQLGARGIAGRDVFPRGSDAPEASGPAPLAEIGLFSLLDAFNAVLARAKADLAFQVIAEGVSIQDRMRQLVDRLRERREMSFEQLFEGQATIYEMVVTFLALLEMAKRRLVRMYQADPSSPIHLRSTVVDADDVVQKALEDADLERTEERDEGIERTEVRTEEREEDSPLDRRAALESRSFDPDAGTFDDDEVFDREAALRSRVSFDEPGPDDPDGLEREGERFRNLTTGEIPIAREDEDEDA